MATTGRTGAVLQTSDRAAFQQLARDELTGLYALARRLTGRDAEDLVQEALLRACRSFGSLRDHQAGGQWLRVILTNVWRDRLRKDNREPTEVSLDDAEGFSLYRTVVDEDPFPYSDTLHLDFLGGFCEDDIHTVATPNTGDATTGALGRPGDNVRVAVQVERPALVVANAVADRLPTGAVTVEVAVLELEAGALGGLGDEPHLHFTGVGFVGLDLPGGADVPAEHDPVRRLVGEHTGPVALAAVLGAVVDVAAHMRLEPRLGDRRAQEVVLLGLEVTEPLDEHLEGTVDRHVDHDLATDDHIISNGHGFSSGCSSTRSS
jgi:hypothetical protein